MSAIGRVALTAWVAVVAAMLFIGLLATIALLSYFAYAEFAAAQASKAISDWEGEAIEPEDVSWEGVTLDQPGRALVKGSRVEDGICAGRSIPMVLSNDRNENIGGLWSRNIWTDPERCVHLIEYGYTSRERVEGFKGNSPAPMITQIAEPVAP